MSMTSFKVSFRILIASLNVTWLNTIIAEEQFRLIYLRCLRAIIYFGFLRNKAGTDHGIIINVFFNSLSGGWSPTGSIRHGGH
jgi:hypothetical protein